MKKYLGAAKIFFYFHLYPKLYETEIEVLGQLSVMKKKLGPIIYFFLKYCSVGTKKLHKMKVNFFFPKHLFTVKLFFFEFVKSSKIHIFSALMTLLCIQNLNQITETIQERKLFGEIQYKTTQLMYVSSNCFVVGGKKQYICSFQHFFLV